MKEGGEREENGEALTRSCSASSSTARMCSCVARKTSGVRPLSRVERLPVIGSASMHARSAASELPKTTKASEAAPPPGPLRKRCTARCDAGGLGVWSPSRPPKKDSTICSVVPAGSERSCTMPLVASGSDDNGR